MLEDEAGIEIVGIADDGVDAVEKACSLQPDLVTMDIFMPEMDGLEATRRIMERCPTRIVIVSSMVNARDQRYSFKAMQAGAIEVIGKPQGLASTRYDEVKAGLVRSIEKIMRAVPSRRFSWVADLPARAADQALRSQPVERAHPPSFAPRQVAPLSIVDVAIPEYRPTVVCIGGSTGAPAVISDILSGLPEGFPIPIVVAQHIVKGFAVGMATWLDATVRLDVHVAGLGEKLRKGTVVLAPDDRHLVFKKPGEVAIIRKRDKDLYAPSVNRLFSSAAQVYGASAMGMILTGMGHDGSPGLAEMRQMGSLCVCQNEETSVVYGMPRVAVESGAVQEELSPPQMIELLRQVAGLPES